MPKLHSISKHIASTRFVVMVLLLTVWASCSRVQLRQGWSSHLGPVMPHDTFPADCSLCHISENWTTLKKDFQFDHEAETGVALTGAHRQAQCLMCHNDRGPVAQFAAKGCSGCHVDIHLGHLGPNCDSCHDDTNWRPREAIAKHNMTRFPLVGAHLAVECFRCHEGADTGLFLPLDVNCSSCHLDDYQATTNPNHTQAGFGTDCQDCHTPFSWRGATTFSHPRSFPLTAGHSGQECSACHTNGNFAGLSTDCASCHMGDFQSTTSPNHAAAGFDTNCKSCHDTRTWHNATFNHPMSFPLAAGHGGLNCSDCHAGGVFTGLSTACATCHIDDYQSTTQPNHAANGFSTDCKECHTTASWQGANVIHPASFPLTAGHGGLSCSNCHTGGVHTGLSTDCATCHLDDYQSTTDPNHAANGFSTDCKQCHTTATWQGANLTHPASFPLTAGHGGLNCSQCHVGGVYTGLSNDCATCHLDDYQGTRDPNHAANGFSTDCKQCHNTTGWEGAILTHPASFPLTAGHGGLNCNQCHVGGVYNGLSRDCATCHLDDYQGTTDPNHSANGLSTDCTQCHNTTGWEGAILTHPASFPLTAGHGGLNCNQCHVGGVYTGLSRDCATCHLDDYQGTNNPKHSAAAFSTTCTGCHSTTTWQPAMYTHIATFPLTSGHGGLSCNACHGSNVYAGLPKDCVSCHLADYQGATNPNHAATGFSTDCKFCHNTSNWNDAVFNHAFPIDRGAHRNLDCNDCHLVPSSPTQFSCINCHEHRQTSMDSKHREVSGYVWSSPACYQCHPNGRH